LLPHILTAKRVDLALAHIAPMSAIQVPAAIGTRLESTIVNMLLREKKKFVLLRRVVDHRRRQDRSIVLHAVDASQQIAAHSRRDAPERSAAQRRRLRRDRDFYREFFSPKYVSLSLNFELRLSVDFPHTPDVIPGGQNRGFKRK
jgi:hypothetical protein